MRKLLLPAMNPDPASEGRLEQRTNMFVMASMLAETGSVPVKMRNLSARGALVEGAALPRAGSPFRLSRGALSIRGTVVWSERGRAGLMFDSPATVSEWLPRAQNNIAQQRIDELVLQLKSGKRSLPLARQSIEPAEQACMTSASDLFRLKDALQSLAEDLAEEPALVERLGSKLQTLDIAAQTLGKLARLR